MGRSDAPLFIMNNPTTIACVGCGALVEDSAGATHEYIGASAGCWALYGAVMARGYQDAAYGQAGHMVNDTYCVQHPGVPARKSIQSVAVHLISLYRALERGATPAEGPDIIRHALQFAAHYVWLTPPPSWGALTILDLYGAADATTFQRLVRAWAQTVWAAWQPHHATIHTWASW